MSDESNAINELTIGIGIAASAVTEALLAIQAVQGRGVETAKEMRGMLDGMQKELAVLSEIYESLELLAECVSPPAHLGSKLETPTTFRIEKWVEQLT